MSDRPTSKCSGKSHKVGRLGDACWHGTCYVYEYHLSFLHVENTFSFHVIRLLSKFPLVMD